MDHTLLEYDEATRTAIVFTTPASCTPFVVCSGDALSDVVARCGKVVPGPARRRGGAGAGPRL